MRRLFFLASLFAMPVWATTYHVTSTGTCANHGTLTGPCSSTTTCGSISAPCCTLEAATNITALTSGDIIELHHQTHNTGSVTVSPRTYRANINDAGVTIKEAALDTAVVDGGSSLMFGLQVTGNSVTVDGITWSNFVGGSESPNSSFRGGVLDWDSGADGGRIRNNIITASDSSSTEYGSAAIKINEDSDDFIIEDNLIQGNAGNGIYTIQPSGSSGFIIRENTFLLTCSGAGGARGITLQGYAAGPAAIYNNVWTSCPSSSCSSSPLYLREIEEQRVYFWNNRIGDNCFGTSGGIITQDNACPMTADNVFTDEDVCIFNNTWDDGASGSGNTVGWQTRFAGMRMVNNIFDRPNHGVRGSRSECEGCDCDTCTASDVDCSDCVAVSDCHHNDDKTWDESTLYGFNILENFSGSVLLTTPGTNPTGHITVTSNTTSASQITSRDSSQNLTAATSGGTNNPCGQGANICQIVAAGETILCNEDFNGDARGSAWDIGADEFASTSCGNDIKEGSEICDDTNGDGVDFGADSCQVRGFDGGFLTCVACASVTTENCTTSVPSHSIMKGVKIKGGTIK